MEICRPHSLNAIAIYVHLITAIICLALPAFAAIVTHNAAVAAAGRPAPVHPHNACFHRISPQSHCHTAANGQPQPIHHAVRYDVAFAQGSRAQAAPAPIDPGKFSHSVTTGQFALRLTCTETTSARCLAMLKTLQTAATLYSSMLNLSPTRPIVLSATYKSFCANPPAQNGGGAGFVSTECPARLKSALGSAFPSTQWNLFGLEGVDPDYTYPQALAKQLSVVDLPWADSDISAQFNLRNSQAFCHTPSTTGSCTIPCISGPLAWYAYVMATPCANATAGKGATPLEFFTKVLQSRIGDLVKDVYGAHAQGRVVFVYPDRRNAAAGGNTANGGNSTAATQAMPETCQAAILRPVVDQADFLALHTPDAFAPGSSLTHVFNMPSPGGPNFLLRPTTEPGATLWSLASSNGLWVCGGIAKKRNAGRCVYGAKGAVNPVGPGVLRVLDALGYTVQSGWGVDVAHGQRERGRRAGRGVGRVGGEEREARCKGSWWAA
ncbi:hypothetical protein BCR44DRAFT_1437687, partial [Catenaria anguillulae PL171]